MLEMVKNTCRDEEESKLKPDTSSSPPPPCRLQESSPSRVRWAEGITFLTTAVGAAVTPAVALVVPPVVAAAAAAF